MTTSTVPEPTGKIILFTRYPVAGKSKTRLIPALGKHDAAQLQKKMTEHILTTLQGLEKQLGFALEVRYTGATRAEMQNWLALSAPALNEQGRGDLGARLSRAFAAAFEAGDTRVMAIGADCPSLTADIVRSGYESLQKDDVVLGPALDGGYYLIGMRCYWPELFSRISWGTGHVLDQTCATAARRGLTYTLLPSLADIDRPEDLRHCRHLT